MAGLSHIATVSDNFLTDEIHILDWLINWSLAWHLQCAKSRPLL